MFASPVERVRIAPCRHMSGRMRSTTSKYSPNRCSARRIISVANATWTISEIRDLVEGIQTNVWDRCRVRVSPWTIASKLRLWLV